MYISVARIAKAVGVLSLVISSGHAPSVAGDVSSSNTMTIATPWDPGTMDPQMHRLRYAQIISHTMRDKLYYPEPPGIAQVPLLAASVVQVDELTYDVKIREGVRFHNGDELTAADVVYTFERLWDPATKSPRARMGNMANVQSVEELDRYTVRWKTKVPFGPVDQAVIGLHLAGQEILHRATYSNLTPEQAASGAVVGVGPFKFVEWVPDQRVVMDAFHDYWQGAPGVERIIWRTIPEESTRVAELLAGSVDMIYPVTPDFVGQLRSAGMQIEIQPGTTTRMLMMNVREGSPFADVEVRKAMNMAIDKESITEHIYQGLALPAEQVAGVGQEGFIEGYDPFPYDPEQARAVLSQIAKPIEIFVDGQGAIAGEAIAEQLRGYGMTVTTVVLDNATHTQINEAGTFDLLLGSGGYGTGNFYFESQFDCPRLDTGRIRTGFCSAELDKQMAAAVAEADPVLRNDRVAAVNKRLTEEFVPWVPLFGEVEVWAMQPYVDGFTGSSAGQILDLWKVTTNK